MDPKTHNFVVSRYVVFDEISSYYAVIVGKKLNSQKFEDIELPTSFNFPSTCFPSPNLQ